MFHVINNKVIYIISFAFVVASFILFPNDFVNASPSPTLQLKSSLITSQYFNDEGPLGLDVNFDGLMEFFTTVYNSPNNKLYGIQSNGALLDFTSLGLSTVNGAYASADAKDLHEILFGNNVLNLFAQKTGASTFSNLPNWPKLSVPQPIISDISGDGVSDYIYLTGNDYIHALSRNGSELNGWPIDVYNVVDFSTSEFAVGDINGDQAKEVIVTGDWYDANDDTFAGIRAYNKSGVFLGTDHETNINISYIDEPVIGDFGTYGQKILQNYAEAFETEDDWWEIGGIKILTKTSTGFSSTKRSIGDKDSLPVYSPIVADIDGVAGPEIIIVDNGYCGDPDADHVLACPDARIHVYKLNTTYELDGWPVNIFAEVYGPPIAGDIDGDGKQEIIMSTSRGIMAWRSDGTRFMVTNGTEQTITTITARSSDNAYIVKKINNSTSGALNTAVWFDRIEAEEELDYVYIFPGNVSLPTTATGFDDAMYYGTLSPIQTFTGTYSGWSLSVPGNSIQVVLRSDDLTNYYGFSIKKVLNGTSKDFGNEFKVALGDTLFLSEGSPWLGDANNDRYLDLAAAANGRIYVFNLNVPYAPERLGWPMYRHDPGRTNNYTPPQTRPAASAPQLQWIGNRVVREGRLFQLQLKAFDLDGGVLTYRLDSPMPSGASLVGNTFKITPTSASPRSINLRFTVLDSGGLFDFEDMTLSVEANYNPVFPPIPSQNINEGELFTYTFIATDLNKNDILTFSASGLPSGATLSTDGKFSWKPSLSQANFYTILIAVSDGLATRTQIIEITVNDASVIYSEYFESSTVSLVPSGLWHVASNRFNTGQKSFAYNKTDGAPPDPDYNTGTNNSGTLISSPIVIPAGVNKVIFSFFSWSSTENNTSNNTSYAYDKRTVDISDNGGNSWTLGVSVIDSGWMKNSIDLKSYIGKTILLRFNFDSIDGVANDYEGWYIDDINIMAITPPVIEDIKPPTISITSPASGASFWAGQTLIVSASTTDNVGVSSVLFGGGTSAFGPDQTDSTFPYSVSVPITATSTIGRHSLFAKAFDTSDNATFVGPIYFNIVAVPIPNPALVFVSKTDFPMSGAIYTAYKLNVTNWASFPSTLFVPSTVLPLCGSPSMRTWVNIYNGATNAYLYGFCAFTSPQSLATLQFNVIKNSASPQSLYVTVNDRQTNTIYRSNTVSVGGTVLGASTEATSQDYLNALANMRNILQNMLGGLK